VTSDRIDYQAGFFKALFFKIQNTPKLNQLNHQAREQLHPFGQGPYQPHLSLLYGDITVKEKNQIIAELALPVQPILLDKLKLVKGHKNTTQWQVIKEWDLED